MTKTLPNDGFKTYFAEKLWEMIPSIYRHEDALMSNPGVLRALIEVMAEQGATLRRSQDALWEDQFIELCNNWAIPYIGDLLGTRMLPPLYKRAMRSDVAKTIYYRRRKGTLRILEELISDIAGWEGKVVENFHRLGRTRHGLDPQIANLTGLYTNTPPGGVADLRQAQASELTNSPFSEFHHTPDMRQHRGLQGRYGITKLAFHLYRLKVYPIVGSTPYQLPDGLMLPNENTLPSPSYTFDPSGRFIPLFAPRQRQTRDFDWDSWHSALEWEIPAPIRCRLLNHSEFVITDEVIEFIDSEGLSTTANALRSLKGQVFKTVARFHLTLRTIDQTNLIDNHVRYRSLLRISIQKNCGKYHLLPHALFVETPEGFGIKERVLGGNASSAATFSAEKQLLIDAEKGRFRFINGAITSDIAVHYHYGFSANIGAGTYARPFIREEAPNMNRSGGGLLMAANIAANGITQINDSKTYSPIQSRSGIANMYLRANKTQRPYLLLDTGDNWTLSAPSATSTDACLTLEGLWIGARSSSSIVLQGDYETVIIRHCTIDPGGYRDVAHPLTWGTDAANDISPVTLVIEGTIEQLIIDASITGPIITRDNGQIETLLIQNSIVQSLIPSEPALNIKNGLVITRRVSLFGNVQVHRLQASETLITGKAQVTDNQRGCFRFSAAWNNSYLPRPYESHFFEDTQHWFSSRVFGHPGYGQLSETAPESLKRGAENGSEIGAFNTLLQPIRMDNLRTKVEEFMPFGLIPIFINET